MNRLGSATSPYLLQHAANPVDWWPWGGDAFAEAKRRDVPVLISVGYAACHWCHVMAHESFEDPGVAELVNRDFVAIKVDREERPDVDAVYMTATQAMTGQGGWPMTVFATPGGQPFFCGTYFPRPAFTRLLQSVSEAWRDQRDAVTRQGSAVVEAIGNALGAVGPTSPLSAGALDAAAAGLAGEFDEVHGGFGDAPKFPPHLNLLFLLRHHQRTGDRTSLEMVRQTCEQMARGGIYDQVAGGFARYSVDERWLVPHFEKMLYDNALLLRAYTDLWRLTGDPLARRVALGTAEFLFADLATGQGGFASSLDADAAGAEGSTYVWTPAQLRDVLGDEDGAFAADLFGVTERGTFEHGTSVLRMTRDIDAADEAIRARAESVVARLRVARAKRPQPGRDDKVVAAWNGLAITALVDLARTLPEAADVAAVVRAAELLAGTHLVAGRLRRVSRAGIAGEPAGVLDDYGCVAEAFCALHELTGQGRWLELAGQLLDTALVHFGNDRGGFYDTADDAERLVTRPADPTDNATPSGLSAVAAALTRYAALTGEPRYREAAQAALATVLPLATQHPRFTGYACAVGEALLSGPYEIAIVADSDAGLLRDAAWRLAPPGAVLVSGRPGQAGVPLLADRPTLGGQPTAYVCRGFVCDRPVTTVAELTTQLGR
ncbi:MAG: uncharacterized protein V7603_5241 [Micromonosporaceae bacterium]